MQHCFWILNNDLGALATIGNLILVYPILVLNGLYIV